MADTELGRLLETVFQIFKYSAVRQKPCDKLSSAEFSQLVREELPNLLQESRTREATDRLFKEMDQNKDGQLSFVEFMTLLGKFYMDTHPEFHQDP